MIAKWKVIPIVLLFFLPAAHINSRPLSGKPRGDNLIIGDYYNPTVINPVLVSSGVSAYQIYLIFDGLIKIDKKMEVQKHLASSWRISPDGLRYTLQLRKGVKFHDGVEVTAEDVKFTFGKIKEAKGGSPYWNSFKVVERVIVRDRYTVEVILSRPNASFLFALDVGILPKHVTSNLIIGTGPFKIVKFSPDEITLEANEDYFLGRPYLNRIVIKTFENQQIAWAKLLRGDVDFIPEVPLEQYRLTTRMSSFKMHSFLAPYYYILALNLNNNLFKDRRIRQALNYAVNKEEIISKVLDGKGQVASGTIYPQSWAYNPEAEPYPYDPKKALELLKEAGWNDTDGDHFLDKDGEPLRFVVYGPAGDHIAESSVLEIQQQLLDIGVMMDVNIYPLEALTEEYLHKKRFEVAFSYIISDDPDKNYQFWHSSQIEGGFNVFSHRNKRVDTLLDKGRETLDWQERKRIYYQLQREFRENPPGIFLFWRQCLVAIDRRFVGVMPNAAGGILWNIHEWYVPKEEQKY